MRLRVFDAEAGEERAERIAAADAFFVDELLLVLLERGDLVGQVRQFQVLRNRGDGQVGGIGSDRCNAHGAKGAHAQEDGAGAQDAGFAGLRQQR